MTIPLRVATMFFLCYLITSLISLLYGASSMSNQLPVVCLLGNAPNEDAAERVFLMWGRRFPGVYYLWNVTNTPAVERRGENCDEIHFLSRGPVRLSFVEGIELALRRARSICSWNCDYYFTHDDDLDFYINSPYLDRSKVPHISDVLLAALQKYKPLVASFPWDAGLRTHKNLVEIYAHWQASRVGPLVAFDNGMVLYHRSVVDLFIPYSPRGEGGFIGRWTLGAHFINLLVSTSLMNHSLCINSLSYVNNINLDNLSPAERMSERIVDPKQRVVHYRSGPRHAYEFPMNDAYKSFLAGALKCVGTSCRWGRQLTISDVQGWVPLHGERDPRTLRPVDVIKMLTTRLHVNHEAFQNNALVNAISTDELRSMQFRIVRSLRINIFTVDRPKSFLRLWYSLLKALQHVRERMQVSIHIYQDFAPGALWQEQRELLQKEALHGVKFVAHLSITFRGLRQMILNSWQPTSDDEFCLFLEDDIELSTVALEYVDAMIQRHWYGTNLAPRNLLGVSLYRPRYSEVTESFMTIPFKTPSFLYQYPCSWGEVFAARPWHNFLDWLQTSQKSDYLIPNSYTNRWPTSNSWKKALLHWMVLTGSVMVYPNMFGNMSLSTNHLEFGTNDRSSENSTFLVKMKEKFTVPLFHAKNYSFAEISMFNDVPVLDVQGHISPKIAPLSLASISSFDKCTLVMAVCDRVSTWRERVLHYGDAWFVHSFVIIWQNCLPSHPVPLVEDVDLMPFPIHILSFPRNSLNNRFLPLPKHIGATDCIISIDDDFDMPLRNLSFAVKTWQGHFWNHLVGFAGFGRNHLWDSDNHKWRYTTAMREQLSSIVLPTCMIYHRKYQAYYAALPTRVLDMVDQLMNCDDILFNFLVSNLTKSGPVVIDGDVYPKYESKAANVSGLWHRPGHFHNRSDCVNYLVDVFDGMPLRYTLRYFQVDSIHGYGSSPGVPPSLRHHKHSATLPEGLLPSKGR